MKRLRLIGLWLIGLWLLLLCPSVAFADMRIAQESSSASPTTSGNAGPSASLPDAMVRDIADYARKQLPAATLPDGKRAGPDSPEEKSQRFLLPFDDIHRVARRGAISGYAELCGLDWENRSYIPFMSEEVNSGRWTDRQIVYIGLVHEITQGAFEHNLKGKPCPDDIKARLDSSLYNPGKPRF